MNNPKDKTTAEVVRCACNGITRQNSRPCPRCVDRGWYMQKPRRVTMEHAAHLAFNAYVTAEKALGKNAATSLCLDAALNKLRDAGVLNVREG